MPTKVGGIDLRIFEEYRRIKNKLHHLIELIVTPRTSETYSMAQQHLHGICDHFTSPLPRHCQKHERFIVFVALIGT